MGEKLLSVLLEELDVVRIVCKTGNCNAVIEVTLQAILDQIDKRTNNTIRCPMCNALIEDPGHFNHLSKLAEAFESLKKRSADLQVQFLIRSVLDK